MILTSFLSLLAIIIVGLGAVVFLFFSVIPILRGAPYVPLHKKWLDTALAFLDLKPGAKIVDLGSGDGRILIETAKRGAVSFGYEINPILVLQTKQKAKKQGVKNLVFCYWKSFWGVDFGQFDVVFIFGISHIMKALEKKAKKELKPGAKVVCFGFKLPNWEPIFSENGAHIYLHTKQDYGVGVNQKS